MFTVRNIVKAYGGRTILDGVSLTIGQGERLAIIGPNGAGKTTLLRVLAGESPPDSGELVIRSGSAIGYLEQESDPGDSRPILEVAIEDAGENAIAKRIRALEKDLSSATDQAVVEDLSKQLGQLHHHFEMSGGYKLEAEARRILSGLGFGEDQHSLPLNQFSGGWRMRVSLAKLLLRKPDLLLLDEPTNHLDIEALVWFESLLLQYPGSIVFISHDRDFMNRIATRIAELRNGRIEEYTGNYDRYLVEKTRREELLAAARANQDRRHAETQKFINRFRYKATKARQVQSRIKQLEKVEWIDTPIESARLGRFVFPKTGRCGKIVLTLRNVSMAYDGHTVYRDLNFALDRGDKIALVGPNGAGKSTLLKLLAGVIQPDAGTIQPGDQVSRAYFAQHSLEVLDPERTALEEIQRAVPDELPSRLRDILGAFLFSGDDALRPVKTFSGGEKSRLVLACLMARPANLLLMDEPTNHLDIDSRKVLEEALLQYDGTLCLISHDRHLIRSVAKTIIEVGGGRAIVYNTDYEGYLARKAASEAASMTDEVVSFSAATADELSLRRGRQQRRALGGLRTRYYEATRKLKAEIDNLENEIEALEHRKGFLEEDLTKPEVYASGERVTEIRRELKQIEELSIRLNDRWEKAAVELESIDTQFKAEEEGIKLQC